MCAWGVWDEVVCVRVVGAVYVVRGGCMSV